MNETALISRRPGRQKALWVIAFIIISAVLSLIAVDSRISNPLVYPLACLIAAGIVCFYCWLYISEIRLEGDKLIFTRSYLIGQVHTQINVSEIKSLDLRTEGSPKYTFAQLHIGTGSRNYNLELGNLDISVIGQIVKKIIVLNNNIEVTQRLRDFFRV